MIFDVFNGDADGIIALHQLRLAEPCPKARLISGVKRDINLLRTIIGARHSQVTVLDISLETNREPLLTLLADHCTIFYADHHFAGDIPTHAKLETHIDPSPETCTSLIVDQLLHGAYRSWAVAAAFGDNLHETAQQAATALGFDEADIARLREVGELLNYNGYGARLEDLYFTPQDLFRAVQPFRNPLDFHADSESLTTLRNGFNRDMAKAVDCQPLQETVVGRVYQLPAQPWARRVSGVFSNAMARQRPELAHGLVVQNDDRSWRISVRAPLRTKRDADRLCREFPSGGGRAGAAGINCLPPDQLPLFLRRFDQIFGHQTD